MRKLLVGLVGVKIVTLVRGIDVRHVLRCVVVVSVGAAGWNAPRTIDAADLEQPTSVVLDIRPGGDSSPVNLKSKGVLPVAVSATEGFDLSKLNTDTLLLGDPLLIAGGAAPVQPLRSVDVNGHSPFDKLLFFRVSDMVANGVLGPSSSELVLTGTTTDGTSISGTGALSIVPNGDKTPNASPVPEPSTLALLGFGCLGLMGWAWSRRRLGSCG